VAVAVGPADGVAAEPPPGRASGLHPAASAATTPAITKRFIFIRVKRCDAVWQDGNIARARV
jgi:hypothetical protein